MSLERDCINAYSDATSSSSTALPIFSEQGSSSDDWDESRQKAESVNVKDARAKNDTSPVFHEITNRDSATDISMTQASCEDDSEAKSYPDSQLSSECDGAELAVDEFNMKFLTGSELELETLKNMVSSLQKCLETEKDSVFAMRKKLSHTNKEKLDQTSKYNDQILLLQCENVALQARLEEQLVCTEQLEYELAKAKKLHLKEKKFADKRELQDEGVITDLKGRLDETTEKLRALEDVHFTAKKHLSDELFLLQTKLHECDNQLAEAHSTIALNKAESTQLIQHIKEQEIKMKDLLEKVTLTESQCAELKHQLNKSQEKLATKKTQADQQKVIIQELQAKAADLESLLSKEVQEKTEFLQKMQYYEAQVSEYEKALNDEKTLSGELRNEAQILREQYQLLEERNAKQNTEFVEMQSSLRKIEQELSLVQKSLSSEKEDKKDLVSRLKKQLDVQHENMNKLKSDLNTAQTQQKYIDEMIKKVAKELQQVLIDLPVEQSGSNSASTSRDNIDVLHIAASKYKKRLDTLLEERNQAKAQCDSLEKEATSYRQMLYTKEKELEDSKDKISELSKDSSRLTGECAELEAKCATMTVDIETAKSHNHTLTSQCQALKSEISQAKSRYENDTREKLSFLSKLYDIMTSDKITPLFISDQARKGNNWMEITTMVSDAASHLINESYQLRLKVSRLEEMLENKEALTLDMKAEYETHINQLRENFNVTLENHIQKFAEEKSDLEQHYNNMVTESQSRQQRNQWSVEEIWEKLRLADDLNIQLELEKSQLLSKSVILETQQRCLLCAFALLSGSYFPLLERHRQLVEQRKVLCGQLSRFTTFKAQVNDLLSTLVAENPSCSGSEDRKKSVCLLRFRRAVIAVLAAHRLRTGNTANRDLVSRFPNVMCWMVQQEPNCADSVTDNKLISWLCHKDLESIATLSTKETIENIRERKQSFESLELAVSTSLNKMIRQLAILYTWSGDIILSPAKHSRSLASGLLQGLQRALYSKELDRLPTTFPASVIGTKLQEKLLDFIQQMHCTEEERRSQNQAVESLSHAVSKLQAYEVRYSELKVEMDGIQAKLEQTVPLEKMQNVLAELNESLDREKQAQKLLSDQSIQIKDLNRKLANGAADKLHSEQSVQLAIQELHRDLDTKSVALANLSHQLSSLEGERQSLHDNLYDAENALKTAAEDRKAINNYIETLTHAFQKSAADGLKSDLSRVLLSKDLLPITTHNPVLLKIHRLVSQFIELYTSLQLKSAAMNDMVNEQLEEINRLKQELSLVCVGTSKPTNLQFYQYPKTVYPDLPPIKVTEAGYKLPEKPFSPSAADEDSYSYKLLSPKHTPHTDRSSRPVSARGNPSPRLELSGNKRR